MPFVLVKIDTTALPPPEAFLAGEELSVYRAFKIEKRRRDWLGGRLAAKMALAGELAPGGDLRKFTIIADPDGRPTALFGGVPVRCPVSITHSNGVALCAVGRGATAGLGIDLEKTEPRSKAWAEFSFTREELTSHDPTYLTALWTLKEAALKAAGTGLKAALNDIRFIAAGNTLARSIPALAQTPAGPDYGRFLACAANVPSPAVTGSLAGRPEILAIVGALSFKTAQTSDGFVLSAAWR